MIFKKSYNFLIFFFIFGVISSFGINFTISGIVNEYSSNYEENIFIDLKCNEDVNLTLPNNAKKIFLNNISTQDINFFLNDCSRTNVFEYNVAKVEKVGNNVYRIERKFNNFNNINYNYKLIVPITYSIDIEKTVPKKFQLITLDNTKEIIFNKSEVFLVYLIKHDTEDKSITFEHIKEELSEPSSILLIIIAFILGIFLSYIYLKKDIKNIKEGSVPLFVLSKEEREVLEVIKENEGINQKQIAQKLNYSKSRISAIVNDLEQKKLIRREKFGRSFKVYLDKKIH